MTEQGYRLVNYSDSDEEDNDFEFDANGERILEYISIDGEEKSREFVPGMQSPSSTSLSSSSSTKSINTKNKYEEISDSEQSIPDSSDDEEDSSHSSRADPTETTHEPVFVFRAKRRKTTKESFVEEFKELEFEDRDFDVKDSILGLDENIANVLVQQPSGATGFIPIRVFRDKYPQEFIDYLLSHITGGFPEQSHGKRKRNVSEEFE
mmetsp:Transcript_4585/g.4972  ORF Transcript_4585/g.4972 Transcript_4585/m.4972 type:complete len:208 (-) Transcript_4585:23-646(-)